MENKLHFFIKEDGELYVTPEVPERPLGIGKVGHILMDAPFIEYEQDLQTAKDNAIKVENKEEVEKHISVHCTGWSPMNVGQIYSLECKMENRSRPIIGKYDDNGKTVYEKVANIIFDEPKKEVVICNNCRSFHFATIVSCTDCGYKSFSKTHHSDARFVKEAAQPEETQETLWREVKGLIALDVDPKCHFNITRKP